MFKKFEKAVLNGVQSKSQRKFILIGTIVALILSVMMIPTELVLAKMLPGKNNDTYNIYVKLPDGSSIEQTTSVSNCVASVMQKEKDVKNLEVFLGMGSPLDFAGLIKGSQFKNSENVAELVVNLTKKDERKEPSYIMVQRLRPVVLKTCQPIVPQSDISFVEPPAGPPTLAAIVAEIYGDNADGIRVLSTKVENIFKKTKGLVDVDTMEDTIYSTFDIKVDAEKAARSGIAIKQINDIMYLAFEGMDIAVKNSAKYNDQIPIFLSLSNDTKRFTKKDLDAVQSKLSSLKLNVRNQ